MSVAIWGKDRHRLSVGDPLCQCGHGRSLHGGKPPGCAGCAAWRAAGVASPTGSWCAGSSTLPLRILPWLRGREQQAAAPSTATASPPDLDTGAETSSAS